MEEDEDWANETIAFMKVAGSIVAVLMVIMFVASINWVSLLRR